MTETIKTVMNDGRVFDDVPDERPDLVLFDGWFSDDGPVKTFSGDKAGLLQAAAEIIRRRTQKGN
jgi:hypothetical protein